MFLLQGLAGINWFDTSAQLGMRHEDDQPVSFSPAVSTALKESAERDHFICVSIPLPPPSLRGDAMGQVDGCRGTDIQTPTLRWFSLQQLKLADKLNATLCSGPPKPPRWPSVALHFT